VTVVKDIATFWVDERSPIINDHRLRPTTGRPATTVWLSYYYYVSYIPDERAQYTDKK